MKTFRLRCKKLCAVVLMIVTAFGFSFATPKTAQAANTKYWIKVNKQANVATVYQLKNGTYKPIKAFLVSCGGANTPAGTFYTPAKYRWQTLMGPSYGQYCTRVHGGVLFHSVWYYEKNPSTQSTVQFNKLGQTASHGCIRLSVGDAKWIYDNCALGTKVTVYSSSNPGPLGKPKGIKVSTARRQYWDPTDPSKKNPYRKQKATLTVATVSQNKKLVLRADVSEKYYNSLNSINNANFKTPYDNRVYALPDLSGKLLSVGKAAGTNSFFIPVTFEFDNRGDIIPGSFVEIYLLSYPMENVLSLPVSALTNEMGNFYVYRQLDEEGYQKQEVTLGANNGKEVQVLSGLTPGDRIVTRGAYQVKMASASAAIPGHTHEH